MTKVHDNATDIITFARNSTGTALRRVGYGDELVVDGSGNWVGDFDVAADLNSWADLGSSSAWESGSKAISITYAAGATGAYTTFPTEAGKIYQATAEVISSTGYSTSTRLRCGNGTVADAGLIDSDAITAPGVVSVLFVATGTTSYVYLRNDLSYTTAWDNISVKEVIFDRPSDDLVLFDHPDDIPRIEYAADGSLKGLLIEEQRTNLVTYSEDFTNVNWSKNSVSIGSAATGPDGGLSAVKLVEDTSSSRHTIRDGVSISPSTVATFSCYVKASERAFVSLSAVYFANSAGCAAIFDLNGDVSKGLGGDTAGYEVISRSIEDVGSGWKRVSISFNVPAANVQDTFIIGVSDSYSPTFDYAQRAASYTGDGTSGILVYGAQLEAGSFATSYIPTSGSQQTRSADLASIPVTAFGYNQDAGTVVVEASKFGNNNYPRTAMLDSSTEANSIGLGAWNDPTALFGFIVSGGVVQASIGLGANGSVGTSVFKHGLAFTENSANAAVNGFIGSEDTTVTLPEVTTLRLGRNEQISQHLNGHIKSLSYFPRRLTDAQLQSLTE